MAGFGNSLLSALLAWVKAGARWLWAAVSGDENSLLAWLGGNWQSLALALCLVGVAVDLAVYLLRWRPYRVWLSFFRRLRRRWGKGEAEAGEEALPQVSEAEAPSPPVPSRVPWVPPEQEAPATALYAAVSFQEAPPEEEAPAPPRERRRRAERHANRLRLRMPHLLNAGSAEESHVRLKRIEPSRSREEAYNAPYIPPQWHQPDPTPRTRNRRSRHA
ncbi:MAG: hypothetical protein IKP40_00645 [Clostridia bacterium]|nr:hypothetical protein [Clostridia bacterium]